MMGNYHQEATDPEGRWSCNHVPEKFGMITWSLIHREYQDVTYGTSAPEAGSSIGLNRLPKADYLAGRALMTMKRGLVVAGIVVDEAGQPVVNTKVTLGHYYDKPEANVMTDAKGKFQFQNGRPKETFLTVQASGFAPQDRKFTPQPDAVEQRFVLNRGGLLRGRVLEESGHSISKASIMAESDPNNHNTFEWRGRTDAEGRFEWTNAPLEKTAYRVGAGEYDSKSGLVWPADGTEHVVTLTKNTRKRLLLTTRAFDAETKQPIEAFKVAVAEGQEPVTNGNAIVGLGLSTPQPKGEGRAGVGTVTLSSYTTRFAAEIQADGYLPTRVTNVNSGQGELTLDFELKKGDPVRGVVRLPDGEPLEGALVMLLAERDQVQMLLPAQFQADRVPIAGRTQTDAQGRFHFAPRLEMNCVIVSHALGFAEVSVDALQQLSEIVLQPWGRIKGDLKVGTQPSANQTIQLQNMYWRFTGWPSLMLMLQVQTDDGGHFVFEGVPPGQRKVSFSPKFRKDKMGALGFSHDQIVVVAPGETSYVTLGGAGRAVVGRISAEGISKPIEWAQDVHKLTLKVGLPPEAVVPERNAFASDQNYSNAMQHYIDRSRAYWLSDAGREAQRMERTYMLLFSPDGSFRVNDVPPGTYELSVTPTEPPAPVKMAGGGTSFFAVGTTPIGSVKVEVVVPEIGDAQEGTPVDLGMFRLKPTAP